MKRTAIVIVIAAISSVLSFNALAYDISSLVAHWNFDESSGSTVNDVSSNSNDGIIQNIGDTSREVGYDGTGYSLNFGGTNGYVLVLDDDTLDLTDEGTLSFWAKFDAGNPVSYVAFNKEGSIKVSTLADPVESLCEVKITDADDVICIKTLGLPRALWTQYVIVWKKGRIAIYKHEAGEDIDYDVLKVLATVETVTINESIKVTASDITIGFDGNNFLSGNIDEMTIWNKALPFGAVKELMSGSVAGLAAYAPTYEDLGETDHLVGYWDFEAIVDDGIDKWFLDASVNNGHAIVRDSSYVGLIAHPGYGNAMNLLNSTSTGWGCVQMPNSQALGLIKEEGTVGFWMKMKRSGSGFYNWKKQGFFALNSRMYGYSDGYQRGIKMQPWEDNSLALNTNKYPINPDEWVYMTWVYKDSRITAYRNGISNTHGAQKHEDGSPVVPAPTSLRSWGTTVGYGDDDGVSFGYDTTDGNFTDQTFRFPGALDELSIWDRALEHYEVKALYEGGVDAVLAGVAAPAYPYPEELMAYWSMDDVSGAVITDDTLRGHDGVITRYEYNAVNWTDDFLVGDNSQTAWVTGRFGGALDLGNANQADLRTNAQLGASATLRCEPQMTISMWVDIHNDIDTDLVSSLILYSLKDHEIISPAASSQGGDADAFRFGWYKTVGSQDYYWTPFFEYGDTWTHYAYVVNYDTNTSSGTVTTYVNGVNMSETAMTTWSYDKCPGPLMQQNWLGGGSGDLLPLANNSTIYGKVDEFAIWSRTLSDTEIATVYQTGVPSLYGGDKAYTVYRSTSLSGWAEVDSGTVSASDPIMVDLVSLELTGMTIDITWDVNGETISYSGTDTGDKVFYKLKVE
jgi:concanavalin A-like lectin/glucanase superfamily protein